MNDSEDSESVSKPSWDSSQLHMRTWLDDLALWLPTQSSDYATLVEHGYVLTSQGKVATHDLDHALAIRDRLQQVNTFDDPSPRVPTFTFCEPSTAQAAAGTAGPQTRSQALTGASAAPAATATSASVSVSTATVPRPPPLTPDESKRVGSEYNGLSSGTPPSVSRALVMHSGRASSHIHVMSANDAARCMH
eukprot:3373379-Pleurochrysis_carterae.AAC.1